MEDYKKEIVEMIEKIEDEKVIELTYWFVKRGYEEKKERS